MINVDVSVIMINYNTYGYACDAIDGIFRYTSGIDYELILIDNASPDGSGEKLHARYGDRVIYVQAGANLGTSKAFNIGAKMARGKYVLWLNTDILIDDNFIKKLRDYMESDPGCGICGGNVLDFNGNPAHSHRKKLTSPSTARREYSYFVRLWRKLFKKQICLQYNYKNKPLEVGYITGADMMIRASLFAQIGYFDENIFMYSEEVDFTWRAAEKTGCKVINVPWAKIRHLEGASFGGENRFNPGRYARNLEGDLVYIGKRFGQKGKLAYLRALKRGNAKYIFMNTIFPNREKKNELKERQKVVGEFLARCEKKSK